MSKESSIQVLTKVKYQLNEGYAKDIVKSLIAGNDVDETEADALFRTLVLDEGWSVNDARVAYLAAVGILG